MTAANRLAPADAGEATAQGLSVYGSLLLQGAMAAARLGDHSGVADLVREAGHVAAALGGDRNEYWTSFGPTNLRLHVVAARVELGEAGVAIEAAEVRHRPVAHAALRDAARRVRGKLPGPLADLARRARIDPL
ncbi:hypothetical protein AB0J86_10115 [Micromonospora sp. NPDC049559]|uniref:hypothetical protein n=1 Tax=Micromonospora sp. NPDC049559 TaxID=3155923 RepID=UPI00341674E9